VRIMPSEERKAYNNVIDMSDLHKFILFFPSVCLFPCSMISTSLFLSNFFVFFFFFFLSIVTIMWRERTTSNGNDLQGFSH
jgi:hypothetical protein